MKQYEVTGMSCAACSARVEKAVSNVPGVTSCSVSLLTNSMGVEGTASDQEIVNAVVAAGYGAAPKGAKKEQTVAEEEEALKDHETPKLRKRLIASNNFQIVLMYFSMGHMMWGWPLPPFYDNNHVAMGLTQLLLTVIIMVINQQTMLIGIGMIGGTWSEFGLYKKLIPPGRRRMSTLPVVAGKAFVYASIYAVTLFYILGLHYKLFHFPTNGHTADIIAFLIPYLLSCIFLGIAVSTLFQRREQSIMLLLWCSIPALMLSGASVPREAMPEWLLPVRPDSAEQQRGRRVHPAPKYGGFVQRRVARGTYPVDSHDSLRRIRCCRHTPSPQEGRR